MSDFSKEYDAMSTIAVRNLRPKLLGTEKTSHQQDTTTVPAWVSGTKVINDESSLCSIVAKLILDRLSMDDEKKEVLKMQLSTYLKSNDIIDEDLLSVMTDLTM